MNLLRADITGSVGEVTGARYKGKSVIKGKIWSKAPANQTQTDSVRAFESLNRLSSAIARQYWQWLGLSANKMLKHNAVAKWLKPCVKNHIFDPENIADVIPSGDHLILSGFDVNTETGEIKAKIESTLDDMDTGKQSYWFAICDSKGTVYYSASSILPQQQLSFFAALSGQEPYYFLAFSETKTEINGKIKYVAGDFVVEMLVPSAELVPFTLSNPTFAVNTAAGNLVNLTLESSAELPVTNTKSVGATAYGVLQGNWITAQQKFQSATNGNYITFPLSDGVDSLQQRLLFPVGGKITIPEFKFYFAGKLYTHEAQELAFSESLPTQYIAIPEKLELYQSTLRYKFADNTTFTPGASTPSYPKTYVAFSPLNQYSTLYVQCSQNGEAYIVVSGYNTYTSLIPEQEQEYTCLSQITAEGITYSFQQPTKVKFPAYRDYIPFTLSNDGVTYHGTRDIVEQFIDQTVLNDVTDVNTEVLLGNELKPSRVHIVYTNGTEEDIAIESCTWGKSPRESFQEGLSKVSFTVKLAKVPQTGIMEYNFYFPPVNFDIKIDGKIYRLYSAAETNVGQPGEW